MWLGEPAAPGLLIPLLLPVPAVLHGGPRGAACAPRGLGPAQGRRLRLCRDAHPGCLGGGGGVARALSPRWGFGNGIWVIPEDITLGLISFN